MGKPFSKELEKINDTLKWGLSQCVEDITQEFEYMKSKPLFVVGSGGSLSACYYATMLYQYTGMIAKAITPLEFFYSKEALRQANVLFISASGRNTDILFAYKTAIEFEPNKLINLCMKTGTPLTKLATQNSISKSFEFDIPSGKDGFLATNTLIAFFAILYKSFHPLDSLNTTDWNVDEEYLESIKEFCCHISSDYTLSVLYGGWGHPVAMDIESKLAEAALGDVLISDIRNFGHGRHNWLDKRGTTSAIVALITPKEETLIEKSLDLLPKHIPILRIKTSFQTPFASIELLIKSFYLINELGKLHKIDPGRPGVPDYGSKLYHLKYSQYYKAESTGSVSGLEKIAISRKAFKLNYDALSEANKMYWHNSYSLYKKKINSATYGAIIFDYDGTLCSDENRFTGFDSEIAASLTNLLKNGIIIGIATGRGQSVRQALEIVIPKEFHDSVLIGYYNCSELALLSDGNKPDKSSIPDPVLSTIHTLINSYNFPSEIKCEIRPNQLTIKIEDKIRWSETKHSIIQLINSRNIPNIQILESTHSMDIINQLNTSKLNIIESCVSMCEKSYLPTQILCIGDKGMWPGNDYLLLSENFSLSVDEVSPLTDSCWNFAPSGIKNTLATKYYLSKLTCNSSGLNISIP